jgi:hypothetical protein
VTPFETWYAANVEPILRNQLAALPKSTHEPIRKASREQMAACWNAAVDESEARVQKFFAGADNPISGSACARSVSELRVTS